MIDDVYRVVQAILNKNSYGVITQDKFNAFAKSAQLKIYYELPDDIRRAKRRRNAIGIKDSLKPLQEALDVFNDRETIQKESDSGSSSGFTEYFVLPDDFFYLDSVWYNNNTKVTELNKKDGRRVLDNSLTAPDTQFPLYEKRGAKVYVFPESLGLTITDGATTANSDLSIYYQRKPIDPKWTALTVGTRTTFNPSDTTFKDFELPEYFFYRLIIEIAFLSGVSLREKEVAELMDKEQTDDLQKQNLN